MSMNHIDAGKLKELFLAAADNLEANKEEINELNVFPVPDGDTGTNMSMTILSAAREVAAIEHPTMENLSKAISSGSLRGARGNSGVILSQLFRGFTREIKQTDEITVEILAAAFTRATETAYKAVMKPKEGTILTVARCMAEKAQEIAPDYEDIIEFAEVVVARGDEALAETPELLPVLKDAGVVDSGGTGLMAVMKGALECLKGNAPARLSPSVSSVRPAAESKPAFVPSAAGAEEEEIKFGYCTEFIINLEKEFSEEEEDGFKEYLSSIGDSLVVVSLDDIVKVHVHTNDPGLAIQKALTFGNLTRMKIDNMREEHHERVIQNAERMAAEQKRADEEKKARSHEPEARPEHKESARVAVAAGEGMTEILKEIGVDYVVSGGQSMNPSTEDLLQAVNAVSANTVYIFPNNKNIILAAQQAASIAEDTKVVVVPTRTVPQGIAAIINFSPEASPEENLEIMAAEIREVKTAEITYAVHNAFINGKDIHEGDIMGIGDDGIVAVGSGVEETALDTLDALIDEDTELVTFYYGADIAEDAAEKLADMAREKFPDCEFECHFGGQPVYYYMISVE